MGQIWQAIYSKAMASSSVKAPGRNFGGGVWKTLIRVFFNNNFLPVLGGYLHSWRTAGSK
jgi:hypothetical protein